jgi:hypothetical protein
MDLEGFALKVIQDRIRAQSRIKAADKTRLSGKETELFQVINEGLPEQVWSRYRDLSRKQRAETISEPEHEEFLRLIDLTERAHGKRMHAVAELANVRGVPIESLMKQLGIKPRRV